MSKAARKTRQAYVMMPLTDLPTQYGSSYVAPSEADGFNCRTYIDATLLLDFDYENWDGGAVHLKTKAKTVLGTDKFYTEIGSDGYANEIVIPASTIIAEEGALSLDLDCDAHNRLQVWAKRVGGTQGKMGIKVVAG